MKRWQDWANLVLGAWMVVSPWALGVADTQNAAAVSAWILGVAIIVFAAIAVSIPQAWEEAINVLLGVALLVSPWALDFSAQEGPTTNAVIVGVIVGALALWAMLSDPSLRERLFHRPQTK
ncbi:MAG TPA: SPW repeat protein [Steroidobacteraceae bacterium]|nr:SPW repeat protein [Steroidobacteraceae bacterium]